MPIYEFLCGSCGKVNEALQKVGDPPPPRCEKCGARKLTKLVSRSAFQLKGGGWYADRYSTPPKEAAPGTATGAGSPAANATPAAGGAGAPAGAAPASPAPSSASAGGATGGSSAPATAPDRPAPKGRRATGS